MTQAYLWRGRVFLLTLGFALFGIGTLNSSASEASETKKILLLHSYGRETAPYDAFITSFQTELLRAWSEKAAFYNFSLEAGRPSLSQDEGAIVQVLRSRFADSKLDLVVAVGARAASFYTQHREELFPAVPMLQIVTQLTVSRASTKPVTRSLASTCGHCGVNGILQLLPETTTVAVIFGTSPLEQFWAARCAGSSPLLKIVSSSSGWITFRFRRYESALLRCAGSGCAVHHFQMDAAGYRTSRTTPSKSSHAASTSPCSVLGKAGGARVWLAGRFFPPGTGRRRVHDGKSCAERRVAEEAATFWADGATIRLAGAQTVAHRREPLPPGSVVLFRPPLCGRAQDGE
jgi:hypothetical protein